MSLAQTKSVLIARSLLLVVFWATSDELASAQNVPPNDTSRPALGGAGLRTPSQAPLFGGLNRYAQHHYGPSGKACLTVTGSAVPQTINPHIFEHLILADNGCGQRIKMHVCYYQSQHCVPTEVPAYGRKEVVLGIMPALKEFRFEFREQFQ
jgi:hypothetical protein